jgi:hypothetical protein
MSGIFAAFRGEFDGLGRGVWSMELKVPSVSRDFTAARVAATGGGDSL